MMLRGGGGGGGGLGVSCIPFLWWVSVSHHSISTVPQGDQVFVCNDEGSALQWISMMLMSLIYSQ